MAKSTSLNVILGSEKMKFIVFVYFPPSYTNFLPYSKYENRPLLNLDLSTWEILKYSKTKNPCHRSSEDFKNEIKKSFKKKVKMLKVQVPVLDLNKI